MEYAVPTVPLGGDQFQLTFPPVACNSLVSFYVSVESAGGDTVTSPYGMAGPLYQVFAEPPEQPVFREAFAVASGWTVNATGDDTATAGQWTWGNPVGTSAQPEDDVSPDNATCWFTGQGSPGGAPVSPNTGQLFTIGALGVDTSDQVGFDIADVTNNAYASLTVGGAPQLYAINLFTGAASLLGAIGGGEAIRGIAIAPPATPASAQFAGAVMANAASFASDAFAPGSLAALFGRFQTTNGQFYAASSQPLPTSLGGIGVKVNGVDAPLLAANNGQINLVLPDTLNDGPATVVVTNADGSIRTSAITIQRTATGIFTYFANGLGTPAAMVTSDGVNFQPVFNPDGAPRSLNASTATTSVYLVLFVTGLRNAPAANPNDANGIAEAVTATFGSTTLPVGWAGPVAGLSGLDQVNIMLPPQLAGAGLVNIRLSAGGYGSNTVTIRVQ